MTGDSYMPWICKISHRSSQVGSIGPFRHSDISVKAVNQHGGRVFIYIV